MNLVLRTKVKDRAENIENASEQNISSIKEINFKSDTFTRSHTHARNAKTMSKKHKHAHTHAVTNKCAINTYE